MNLKKMSFGQLVGIAAAIFVVIMVIAGAIISGSKKPQQKVSSRPAQFDATPTASSVEIEQLRLVVDALQKRVDANATASQAAFTQTANAVDQQNKNIATLESNAQVVIARVSSLEKARAGARVNVVKPEEQAARPTRNERLATSERRASSSNSMQIAEGDSKVMGAVGNRAWIRNGDSEWSVKEGETVPLSGPIVVKRVSPNGQVSVDVQAAR